MKKHGSKAYMVKETQAAYVANKGIIADNLYFYSDSVWIYNDDILKINSIDEKTVDLIVTSPPYNVDIKYNSHDDTMSYDDYFPNPAIMSI